jgi:hypothetical protein
LGEKNEVKAPTTDPVEEGHGKDPRIPAASSPPPQWKRHLLPWALILVGALLRLLWPLDFEWKADEKWTFDVARRTVWEGGAWPWFGMPSSVGLDNPGLSVWPFVGLAWVCRTPAEMTLGIMVLNAMALFGFVLWVRYTWPEENRNWGYWTVALFAVSPLPVLFSRKIWAPDLFPILVLPWMWAHGKRDRAGYAFLWGVVGMLLGQLHMSGFFAAAGLALATLITARRGVKWAPWAAGSACGLLPMLPWIRYVISLKATPGGQKVFSLDLFQLALKYAWGLGIDYSLGNETTAFLDGPVIAGVSTGILRWVRLALWILALAGVIVLCWDRRSLRFPTHIGTYVWGAMIGGGLMHLLCIRIHVHYLVVWSPIFHVMVAWMFSSRPRWLVLAVVLQLCVTVGFLCYVHENGGVRGGDFGVTYRRQIPSVPLRDSE